AIDGYAACLVERLPEELKRKHGLAHPAEAIRDIHFPQTIQAADRARQRFVYEELLILQVALALRRREMRDPALAPVLPCTPLIDSRIRRLFPFTLTGDQDRAIADIVADLNSPRPIQRLVQADVGAGKTAIAAYGLLVAVAAGYQAALMAPTEVLARQ